MGEDMTVIGLSAKRWYKDHGSACNLLIAQVLASAMTTLATSSRTSPLVSGLAMRHQMQHRILESQIALVEPAGN